jgi:O-antigen ligase
MKTMNHLTLASLFVFASFAYVSMSVMALHHVLLLIPGIYFLLHGPKKLSGSAWCLLALWFIYIVSVLVNIPILQNPLKFHLLKTKYFLFGILGIGAFSALAKQQLDKKKIKLLIHIFLLTTAIASLSGLIAYWWGYNPLRMKPACHPERACGMTGMYMTYAYGLQFFLIASIGLALDTGKRYCRPWILYSSLSINALGFFLSYARGATLGLLLALPFFFRRKLKEFIIACVAVGILGLITFFIVPSVHDMFVAQGRMQSISTRMTQFQGAWYAFLEKPIFGVGFKNYEPLSIAIQKRHGITQPVSGAAHNNFLEHLASTGFLGFSAFVAFLCFWLVEMWKRRDIFGLIGVPLIVAFIVSGMGEYTFGDGEILFVLMVFYALTQIQPSSILAKSG